MLSKLTITLIRLTLSREEVKEFSQYLPEVQEQMVVAERG